MAAHGTTMALFLSVRRPRELQADLIDGGYAPDTPAAVVYRASWPDEIVIRCPLRRARRRASARRRSRRRRSCSSGPRSAAARRRPVARLRPGLRPPLPPARPPRPVQEPCLRSPSSASPAARVPPGTEPLLEAADVVAGGRAVLEQLAPAEARHVVLGKDLDATLAALARAGAVCVLASGDPGFFGIVRALVGADRPARRPPRAVVGRARVRAARACRGTTRSSSPPTAATRGPRSTPRCATRRSRSSPSRATPADIVDALARPHRDRRRGARHARRAPRHRAAVRRAQRRDRARAHGRQRHRLAAAHADPLGAARGRVRAPRRDDHQGRGPRRRARRARPRHRRPRLGRRLRQRLGRDRVRAPRRRRRSRSTTTPTRSRSTTRNAAAHGVPVAHRPRRRARRAARAARARRRLRRRRRRDLPRSSTTPRRAARRAVVVTLALIDRIAPTIERSPPTASR